MADRAGDQKRVLALAGQVVDAAVPEHVRVDLAAEGFPAQPLDRSPNGDAGLGEKRHLAFDAPEPGVIVKLDPDFDGDGQHFPQRLPPLEPGHVQAVLRPLAQNAGARQSQRFRDAATGRPHDFQKQPGLQVGGSRQDE